MRDLMYRDKRVEIVFKYFFSVYILYGKVPAGVLFAIIFFVLQNTIRRWPVIHKLSIVSERNACPLTIIPDKAFSWVGNGTTAVKVVISAASPVVCRPVFFNKVCRISCHRPVVTVGANFGINIKIIQQNKFIGQCVAVGCNFLSKQAQAAIPVSLWH